MRDDLKDLPCYDPKLSHEARITDFLSRMTLEEKIAQLTSVWLRPGGGKEGETSEDREKRHLKDGIGHFTRPANIKTPEEAAANLNRLQDYLINKTRLGIPAIAHEESAAGYTAKGATQFPMNIMMASSFEPDLIEEMAGVIRKQMMALGTHLTLAPIVDIARDARWGRCEETFGEDPYLAARMGVAYVKGLQTDDIANGVVGTAKHYVGYGYATGGLNWGPTMIPERELLDFFIPPFAAMVVEADMQSIMNSYSEIDGVPCGASKYLLTDLLRDQFGFTGTVVSDYATLPQLNNLHNFAEGPEDAAAKALDAGLDVELPHRAYYGKPLMAAIEQGLIGEEIIDRSVARVLRQKLMLGLLDGKRVHVDPTQVAVQFDTDDDRALALKAAEKGLVLIKNDNDLLPLSTSGTNIVLIGPHSDSARLMQGDYQYPAHLEPEYQPMALDMKPGRSTSMADGEHETIGLAPTSDMGASSDRSYEKEKVNWADHFVPYKTILDGLSDLAPDCNLTHVPCYGALDGSEDDFSDAIAAARAADVAIVAVGERAGLTREATSGESRDRWDLNLPGNQQALVDAIIATGTPLVVVLMAGRPLTIPTIAEDAGAILQSWFPGEEGGIAIAKVLLGDVNPAGRLPMSMPRHVGQTPTAYNHKPTGRRSIWFTDYVEGSVQPLYNFGHGLSYSSFDYGDIKLSSEGLPSDGSIDLSVTVKNTSDRDGEEVVQLYIRDIAGSVTRPLKELKGFTRVMIPAGSSKTVTFTLDASSLAFHGLNKQLAVEPGAMKALIGASADDIRSEADFAITGDLNPITFRDIRPTKATAA